MKNTAYMYNNGWIMNYGDEIYMYATRAYPTEVLLTPLHKEAGGVPCDHPL